MKAGNRPVRTPPSWITWAFAVPGVIALAIAVVDYTNAPTDNLGFRAFLGLIAGVLFGLAWVSDRRRALRQRKRGAGTR